MKKFIKILCFILAMSMFMGIAVNSEEISDLFLEYIPVDQNASDALCKLGVLKGTENGLELERDVTRAEALTFIQHLTCVGFENIDYESASFDDITNHWAYDTIEKFYHAGYINGTSKTTFEPDRTVTGREFAKILLTVMGYNDIDIENVYDYGVKSNLINNNYTKSLVYNNYTLRRADAIRLCFSAYSAKNSQNKMLYIDLIDKGIYTEKDFEGKIFVSCSKQIPQNYIDKINSYMPSDKNYMFSPLSIKMAMMLAANGAEDETLNEILAAFDIEDIAKFNDFSKELINKYTSYNALNLNISNSIWINESRSPLTFRQEYKDNAEKYFAAEAGTVNDDNALQKINGWVSDKTHGKIPSIIYDSDFWAYLINAVYFKAAWQNEFYPENTYEQDFTDANGNVDKTDFMHKTEWLNYYQSEDSSVRMISLPYKNYEEVYDSEGNFVNMQRYDDIDISMYIILADKYIQAAQLISEAKSEYTYTALELPKFEFSFSAELGNILKSMGIKRAFEKDAQFKKMTDGDMWITDAIHKTYIKVDEKGTEAAAVTAISMAGAALPPEPIEFKADRPFTFVIRDNANGEILFMGKYAFVNNEE